LQQGEIIDVYFFLLEVSGDAGVENGEQDDLEVLKLVQQLVRVHQDIVDHEVFVFGLVALDYGGVERGIVFL
jgi:hypothetical protein